MKVFPGVNMEGISGLVRWADVATEGIDHGRSPRSMMAETNVAVAGRSR